MVKKVVNKGGEVQQSSFRKRSLDALLDSVEYQKSLSDILKSLQKKVGTATNEATLASLFENELYFFIRSFFSIDFTFEKEVGEKIVRHKFSGRMDALCNDLIIEYKHYSELVTETQKIFAISQVKSYIEQLQKSGKQFRAVLTDGSKIKYFYFRDNVLEETPFSNLRIDDLDIVVKSLLTVEHKKFAPENIVDDFSLNAGNKNTKNLAICLFQSLSDENISEKTLMLYKEWEDLFHLSESDSGKNADIEKRRQVLGHIFATEINDNDQEYRALFALHTTYAIIVKLIACKTISKIALNGSITYFSDLTEVTSTELEHFSERLEDGYIFSNIGIINFLEGDFFSWYCSENQWNAEIAKNIKEIIKKLEEYTNLSFTHKYEVVDIFKDLYIEIIPAEVRHSFGEYFTPAWLADFVVKNSIQKIKKDEWRAIDPCCGSGIFIVSLIKNIIEEKNIAALSPSEKEALLNKITCRVIGIDINPLSVLTARVNYFLAILNLRDDNRIEIPVYLGDSANIPKIIYIDGVRCYEYNVTTKKGLIHVDLPCSFVESNSFIETMDYLKSVVKTGDAEIIYNKLLENIPPSDQREAVLEALKLLSDQLVDLHKNKWDGIWVRIVTNFMLVARIRNIDIIVGNPPWIKWEFLPQNYAEKIKSTCIDRHIFSGQSYMGAISLNICALIANVTASSWLNDEGVLAFLMPETLMTQDSYAGFRNFFIEYEKGKRLYLQNTDSWEKAGNPFIETTEKFLTYYYQSNFVDYNATGIPVRYIIKKNKIPIAIINRFRNYEEVSSFFDFEYGFAYQLDNHRTGFTLFHSNNISRLNQFRKIVGNCEYKARSGVEFTPAEVYFIEPVRPGRRLDTYLFKNTKFRAAIYKSLNHNVFELETKYIRPVIKSPHISSFKIEKSNNYCIFPYDEGNRDSVPIKELDKTCKHLVRYLLNNKDLIEKQSQRSRSIARGSDFYSLSKVGMYTFSENIVAFRDNTDPVSAVIKPIQTPWGETRMPICAKHSPYISMDKNNRYITEDEAYYICGILNTFLVRDYLLSSFSGRSISIDLNIKLPLYNQRNASHTKICELSKEAHDQNDDQRINEIIYEIEQIYLEMC